MLNNWEAYHDMTISPEERKAEEAAKASGTHSDELWENQLLYIHL